MVLYLHVIFLGRATAVCKHRNLTSEQRVDVCVVIWSYNSVWCCSNLDTVSHQSFYFSSSVVILVQFSVFMLVHFTTLAPQLKLQSSVFPLCRHLCSKSAISVICGIIIFTWVVPRHGTAWMNPMFEESVQLSITMVVWILALPITDYTLWKYDQHDNF